MSATLKIDDVRYTYNEYKTWEGDWELINGFPLAMAPAPMKKHQSIASLIIHHLLEQLEECIECEVLGEVDYKISNDTVVRPDVVVTCNEEGEHYLTKAPKIIFEIVSNTSAKRDEEYKYTLYESEKVSYYVLVYPDDLIAKIFKIDGKQYDKQGDFSKEKFLFDGFECDVELDFERVFRRFKK